MFRNITTSVAASLITLSFTGVARADQHALGDSPMRAGAGIKIHGKSSLSCITLGSHTATVYANGDVILTDDGSIDGPIFAGGGILGDGDFLSYGTPTPGAPAQTFPDAPTMETWKQTWLAQSGGVAATSITSSISVHNEMTIAAPAFIDGDIDLRDSSTLTLDSNGNGVIVVSGNVMMNDQSTLINNGILVVLGTVTQTPKAHYIVGSRQINGFTPTAFVYNQNAADDAIVFSDTDGSSEQGILYAVTGNIRFHQNTFFTGALIAGSAKGSILIEGNFTQKIPSDLISPVALFVTTP